MMTVQEVLNELRGYETKAKRKERLSQPGPCMESFYDGQAAAYQAAIRLLEDFAKENDLEVK